MKELAEEVNRVYADAGLSLSLPSLRIESASADLLEKIGGTRRSGFTFAPEAATEKMRDLINKYVPDDQVTADRARCLFARLAHDQVLFHDRAPGRNAGRCAGDC